MISFLRSLFKCNGFKFSKFYWDSDGVLIWLERTRKTSDCPRCNKRVKCFEGSFRRKVRDLDMSGMKCFLMFEQRIIRCKCDYRGVEKLDFVDKYSLYSIRFEEFVAQLCQIMNLKSVTKVTGLKWDVVKRIDKKYLAKNQIGIEFANPIRIGVDEVAYQKGHKYLTVVRDVDEAKVIWVEKGRKKEVLDSFFQKLGTSKTSAIKAVVMDMWDPYIASVKENCPEAEIIFDKFHIVKKVNEAIDAVRKEEFAQASVEERKSMKKKRFTILKRRKNLKRKQKETLRQLLKQNKILYTSYLLKEHLANILDDPDPERALRRLKNWIRNVKKSGIKHFLKVLKTIQNYLYGIKNYFKHKLTNAASEGFNNKIGLIKRMAYGFRDIEYFKLKIMQTC